jgi:hypothetical protein
MHLLDWEPGGDFGEAVSGRTETGKKGLSWEVSKTGMHCVYKKRLGAFHLVMFSNKIAYKSSLWKIWQDNSTLGSNLEFQVRKDLLRSLIFKERMLNIVLGSLESSGRRVNRFLQERIRKGVRTVHTQVCLCVCEKEKETYIHIYINTCICMKEIEMYMCVKAV